MDKIIEMEQRETARLLEEAPELAQAAAMGFIAGLEAGLREKKRQSTQDSKEE